MKTEMEIWSEKLFTEEYTKLFGETLEMMEEVGGVKKTMNDYPALIVRKGETPSDKQIDELDAMHAEMLRCRAGGQIRDENQRAAV